MKINIRGHKTEVTEAEKLYITDKLSKLEKLFGNPDEIEVNVVVKQYDFKSRAEISIAAEKYVLRIDEKQDDLYAAIDVAIDKLERQVRKHKTKLNKRIKERLPVAEAFFAVAAEDEKQEETSGVSKTKTIEMLPMDAEEAILQLQLIDHDFYIFNDVNTGKPGVVYERKNGTYGMLEVE